MDWFKHLMTEIGTFLRICGGPAVAVSTDIFTQVAAGGTTPGQIMKTAADLKLLTDAAQQAASACEKMDGTSDESVISSLSSVAQDVAGSGMLDATTSGQIGSISAATSAAITAHEAAGQTPASAAVALAGIAQSVAASGLVDPAVSAKITQISALVGASSPEIAAALQGA